MTSLFAVADIFVVRGLRLGHLRFTPYGLCAAAGLIVSMALARRRARAASLDPEAVWDVGMFAILSCFLASRLLLVLRDPQAFMRYPLLVLSLPSLTFGGMAVAAVMLWAYLRRMRHKGLPLLALLDVFAAPAAALAAWLELGHALDGSEVGMPTALPWGIRDPWSSAPLRVHPVALYGVGASLCIAFALGRTVLRRGAWIERRRGRLAGLGLMLGGAAAFFLDMFTQPVAAPVDLGIEPGQWVALGAILAGALLWTFTPAQGISGISGISAETLPSSPAMTAVPHATTMPNNPLHTEVH